MLYAHEGLWHTMTRIQPLSLSPQKRKTPPRRAHEVAGAHSICQVTRRNQRLTLQAAPMR